MTPPGQKPDKLVTVDVGNSRTKFGLFSALRDGEFPHPDRVIELPAQTGDLDQLLAWLEPHAIEQVGWHLASVNRPAASRIVDWLRERQATTLVRLLGSLDLPLNISLARPDMVGLDRLVAAVAANALRQATRPGVIVDLGTAITVDVVSPEGTFVGGAIMPGIGISARALHAFTDQLPLVEMQHLADAPPALGTATLGAMQAGLFWGAVGGIRELIARMTSTMEVEPQVFLTGGAAASVAKLLSADAHYVPNLTLSGIALAALRDAPPHRQ